MLFRCLCNTEKRKRCFYFILSSRFKPGLEISLCSYFRKLYILLWLEFRSRAGSLHSASGEKRSSNITQEKTERYVHAFDGDDLVSCLSGTFRNLKRLKCKQIFSLAIHRTLFIDCSDWVSQVHCGEVDSPYFSEGEYSNIVCNLPSTTLSAIHLVCFQIVQAVRYSDARMRGKSWNSSKKEYVLSRSQPHLVNIIQFCELKIIILLWPW